MQKNETSYVVFSMENNQTKEYMKLFRNFVLDENDLKALKK